MTDETRKQPLNIGINAQLVTGQAGGVEQTIIGLANGLSKLVDGNENYYFLTIRNHDEWLTPYIGGPTAIVHHQGWRDATSMKYQVRRHLLDRVPGLLTQLKRIRETLGSITQHPQLPKSDVALERAGSQIIHFPYQVGFHTSLPSIYQPWDLQHEHLPEFFTRQQIRNRDTNYRYFCEQAKLVVVASQWIKSDLIDRYKLNGNKIAIVPMAPPTDAYPVPSPEDIEATRAKFELPRTFLIYPAQTFPHKNHIGLISALAQLRYDRGIVIPIVFSGRMNDFYTTIEAHAKKVGVWDQLKFVGFVTPLELQSLYQICQGIVFPSKFEGWGLPVTEAMQAGVPVACSTVTSLPEQVGDAAILFDPDSSQSIADAVFKLWTDAPLRTRLKVLGRQQVSQYTWDRVARDMRATYRFVSGVGLTDDDRCRIAVMTGDHDLFKS